jgi:hypothetical protein
MAVLTFDQASKLLDNMTSMASCAWCAVPFKNSGLKQTATDWLCSDCEERMIFLGPDYDLHPRG